MQRIRDAYKKMARVKDAHKKTAPSSDDDEVVFATPSWIAPRTKRSAMIPIDELRRMQAGLQRVREKVAREATTDDDEDDDARRMEAFARPAVKVPAITQPRDKGPIDDMSPIENFERSTTSSPSSPQPEGCPLTPPEDDGSDSTDDEMPVLFVVPDTTVIVSPHDTPAVFKPRTPNEDMTQEVCDVILEEVIGRKITLERQNSRLSLEKATHNVCQDVAVTITSPDWQKGVRRHLQLESL